MNDVREPHGGGIGWVLGTSVKLTWTCQHLYTSAVHPCLQDDQVQLEMPIRWALKKSKTKHETKSFVLGEVNLK